MEREGRPFREEEGEKREGGGREGEKEEMEMGWRDGPIEKNDVMCFSSAAPSAALGLHGNGNHRNCPDRKRGEGGGMESKSRNLAVNGVSMVAFLIIIRHQSRNSYHICDSLRIDYAGIVGTALEFKPPVLDIGERETCNKLERVLPPPRRSYSVPRSPALAETACQPIEGGIDCRRRRRAKYTRGNSFSHCCCG